MRTHTVIRTLSILALALGLAAGSLAVARAIPIPKKKADPKAAELKPEKAPTDAPPSPEPPTKAEAAQPPPPPTTGGSKITSFVYDAGGRADPMSLPWTVLRLEAKSRVAVAQRAVVECKTPELAGMDGLPGRELAVARAEAALKRVQAIDAQMTAKGYRVKEMTAIIQDTAATLKDVEAERGRIAMEILDEKKRTGEIMETPELPPWVIEKTETGGILWGADAEPVCMIGTFALKVGDAIPTYPGVTVHRIERTTVVYLVQDEEFPVSLVDPKEGE